MSSIADIPKRKMEWEHSRIFERTDGFLGKKKNLTHRWPATWGTWGRVLFPRARQRRREGCWVGSLLLISGIFVTHLLKRVRPLSKRGSYDHRDKQLLRLYFAQHFLRYFYYVCAYVCIHVLCARAHACHNMNIEVRGQC